jgi:hypothetical protein
VSINYKNIVPPNSFIGRYMEHMSSQETPHAYDFWCAAWLISLALGRRVVVPRPRAPVFMNMYAILVAESGTTRKSSAVRICTNIARAFQHSVATTLGEHFEIIENKCTPEHFEAILAEQSREHNSAHAAICVSELVTFFGKEKYTMAMPGVLTDLYDAPSIRVGGGSLVRGSKELRNVCISLLSASTPSWLARAVNPDVIEGGFTSRCLFIMSEKKKAHIAWPEERDDEEAFKRSCVSFLTQTRKRTHAVQSVALRSDALEHFKRWYSRRKESSDTFRASFESREDSHVLRLAAILAVNGDSWAIHPRDIDTAAKIISDVKESGASIFVAGDGSRLINGISVLRDRLIEAGLDGIVQKNLYLKVRPRLTANEFKAALDIMHELALVQRFELKPEGAGRPTTLWRATVDLGQKSSVRLVAEKL